MATFLSILQTVADELGLSRTSTVTATDPQTRQLAALANREGSELMKAVDWTDLQTEYVIEFGAPVEVTGDLTAGSAVVENVSDTSDLVAGAMDVRGQGIQISCRLKSVDTGNSQVTLSETANVTDTGVTLTFTRDTFNLPSDFDRYIDQTQWDRRFQWAMIGPDSPQFDQWQRSGVVTTGPRRRFRQVGKRPTAFRIWPAPSASNDSPGTLVWEYISNGWVLKNDSTYTSSMTANDDQPIFPEGLISLGIKWRFFQVKGFSYAAMQAEYLDWVNREKARNGGQRIISLNARRRGFLLSPTNVQDANFPAPDS